MKVNHLSFSYNHQSYMKDINIQFKDQKITTIIGPNGSGKSTLLMLLSRIYKIQQGSIELDNKNIWDYKIKEFARKVAVVQALREAFPDRFQGLYAQEEFQNVSDVKLDTEKVVADEIKENANTVDFDEDNIIDVEPTDTADKQSEELPPFMQSEEN